MKRQIQTLKKYIIEYTQISRLGNMRIVNISMCWIKKYSK